MVVKREHTVEKVGKFFDTNVGDELVIFNDVDGVYLGLNELGSEIFSILNGPTKVNDLIDSLLGLFDVNRTIIEADVLEFLTKLEQNGLIRLV